MKLGLWVTANFPMSVSPADYFRDLAEQVRLAKQVGFSLICSGQHYLAAPSYRLQTFPLLARLAAEGEGMEVATSVVLLPLHNPVDIAEQASSMDVLTGGKFILGLGLGNIDREYEAFGVDKKRRVSRHEESLDVMVMLWRGGQVEHHGRYFNISKVESTSVWKQPRLWMGGGGDGPIRRAARYGFAWFPGGGAGEGLAQGRAQYLQALQEYGKPVPPDYPTGMAVYVSQDEGSVMEEAHRFHGGRTTAEEFRSRASSQMVVGTPAQAARRVQDFQDRFGLNYLLCRIQVPGMTQAQVLRTIRLLGEEVLPRVRG